MKAITVTGRIKVLGPYLQLEDRAAGPTNVYDYIALEGTNGEEVLIKKVIVENDVARVLRPGGSGTLIMIRRVVRKAGLVGPLGLGLQMVAAKVDGQEASGDWVHTSGPKGWIGAAVVGWLMMGVSRPAGVLVIVVAVGMTLSQFLTKKSVMAAGRSEGFHLRPAKTIS